MVLNRASHLRFLRVEGNPSLSDLVSPTNFVVTSGHKNGFYPPYDGTDGTSVIHCFHKLDKSPHGFLLEE
ncbi:hypothetical protein H671_3g8957 [Cricetulus griseus]|uniref:Uncharacterized protein n=1 Tax=Cricetulus griseus TaxID=10029 RepID=A0A061IDZ6_CRIGR|nr:hypothetical protein H671_3g8957 [Cricetulus griseus]